MKYKIQFSKDKETHITLNLVRTNINAYHGLAFSYVMPSDQKTRKKLFFTKQQVKNAIQYFKSHNKKIIANKIKNSLVVVND